MVYSFSFFLSFFFSLSLARSFCHHLTSSCEKRERETNHRRWESSWLFESNSWSICWPFSLVRARAHTLNLPQCRIYHWLILIKTKREEQIFFSPEVICECICLIWNLIESTRARTGGWRNASSLQRWPMERERGEISLSFFSISSNFSLSTEEMSHFRQSSGNRLANASVRLLRLENQ